MRTFYLLVLEQLSEFHFKGVFDLDTLYALICNIIECPAVFLGKASVERLYAFISGYLYLRDVPVNHCLEGFNEYISKVYKIETDRNWAEIIQFFSNDEKSAFESFKFHFQHFVYLKQQSSSKLWSDSLDDFSE